MDTKKLRYFLAVVEAGSISSAAKQIPIAQPALTRQIHQLEADIGAVLFYRDRKGVSLTQAGHYLYANGQRLLSELESVAKKTRDIANGYRESLSLGISTIHPYIPSITALISRFRSRHPSTQLTLESMLSGPQAEAILAGRLDAGILFIEREDEPRLDYYPLASFRMAVFTSRCHPLIATTPTSLKDFHDAPFIRFSRTSTPGSFDRLDRCFQKVGFVPNTVQECRDDITIRSLVATGMGYAIMPSIMALGDEDIVAYELDDLPIATDLMLAWQKGRQPAAVKTLCLLAEESH
ncbi:LysR family transcriptional regulator [Vreelandella alkaliphila]|uniref:HTH lysR-type domain-containing protein n=1 Tax=Vreelandella alkaliphila TaxID=272774 RepID=A0ABX4HIC8_9GAMM|nr:LysR family transcriptional regulator [Halomonas humidisoli]PAU72083.1 hypothetical protein CK497_09930 [Halomonas humidisoli]